MNTLLVVVCLLGMACNVGSAVSWYERGNMPASQGYALAAIWVLVYTFHLIGHL